MISASAKSSKIHGLGTIATEMIPKGTVVWKFDPRFDFPYSPEEVEQLPTVQARHIRWYSYLSKFSGKYIYSIDDSRFFNHSSDHNTDSVFLPGDTEPSDIANRDISTGEEITVDYPAFDMPSATGKEKYL